jgi:ubiquinone/menaquinone biosynthesis C-methylase UbiE
MSPFDGHPGFYEEDARKNRLYNPITKDTLEAKFSILLPEELIRNKDVLDLGSCLGAAGHWAMSYGAKSYTGVEVQEDFVISSRKLLQQWGEKTSVAQMGIREYLKTLEDKSFDIVVAAGVLQTFIDPQSVICEICRVTKEYVAVEATLPQLVRQGYVDSRSMIMEIGKHTVNFSNGDHQILGISGVLSRPATDFIFESNGFKKEKLHLTPPASKATAAYNIKLPRDVAPLRYFARYKPDNSAHNRNETFLEDAIKTRKGEIENWDVSPTTRCCLNSEEYHNVDKWKFDAGVADKFVDIAKTNIPDYENVIDLSIDIVKKGFKPNPKVIDVGCATGRTLEKLKEAGVRQIYGVDNSEEMLRKINVQDAKLIQSDVFPTNEGPFDIVLANWTLHFVKQRYEYLKDIYEGLQSRGILILTEKTYTSDLTGNLYNNFKEERGLTKEEIRKKELQISGVLEPYPIEWYLQALGEIGFKEIDVVNARLGFVTLLAIKNDPNSYN